MSDITKRPVGRIVLAGGSGFLGSLLARRFAAQGNEVIVLTRCPQPRDDGVLDVYWDGMTLGDWAKYPDGADAVINLAGKSVNCRYHAGNRKEIMESRLCPTRVLGEAISKCQKLPRLWMNASTATIYKHSLTREMNEANGEIGATPEAKDAFSVEVACAWEGEFHKTIAPNTRKVTLRSAMVLGHAKNSVFPMLRRLTRLGLGGPMAGGRQFVSWIHQEDFCRAVEWIMNAEDFEGLVNLASPNPSPNREVMRIFRTVYGVPIGLPAPGWLLELGAFALRTETELVIKSRRVVPGRLVAEGFRFCFPDLIKAVKDLETNPDYSTRTIEPRDARKHTTRSRV